MVGESDMANGEDNKKTLDSKLYSMVVELQNEARSADKPTVDLLRHALFVSSMLKDNDFEKWLKAEIDGYAQGEEVPIYRDVRGTIRGFNPYRGWIPLITVDPKMAVVLEQASKQGIIQSVSEIENLLEQNKEPELHLQFPKQIETMFLRITPGVTSVSLHVSNANLKRLLESVRIRVLEWTFTFEEEVQPVIAPVSSDAEPVQQKKHWIKRIGAWIGANKHWIFEGIGVQILLWVVGILIFVFGLIYYNRESTEPNGTNQQAVTLPPTPTTEPHPSASTINSPVSETEKAIPPLNVTQKRIAARNEQNPFGLEVTIQTTRTTQPTRLLVYFTGAVVDADYYIGMASTAGVRPMPDNPTVVEADISMPAFSPQQPFILTVFSKEPIRVKEVKQAY